MKPDDKCPALDQNGECTALNETVARAEQAEAELADTTDNFGAAMETIQEQLQTILSREWEIKELGAELERLRAGIQAAQTTALAHKHVIRAYASLMESLDCLLDGAP